MNEEHFAIPEGLSEAGQKAAEAIVAYFKSLEVDDFEVYTDSRVFYSPQEWEERGEKYGRNSELVIVYEGSDLYHWFNYNSSWIGFTEKMTEELEAVGVYSEECTSWYCAIYTP